MPKGGHMQKADLFLFLAPHYPGKIGKIRLGWVRLGFINIPI